VVSGFGDEGLGTMQKAFRVFIGVYGKEARIPDIYFFKF